MQFVIAFPELFPPGPSQNTTLFLHPEKMQWSTRRPLPFAMTGRWMGSASRSPWNKHCETSRSSSSTPPRQIT